MSPARPPTSGAPGDGGDTELAIEAPGADEVMVAPWPLMLRHRLHRRARASRRFPWVVLATVLFGLGSVGFTITLLAVSVPGIADDFGAADSTLTWVITGPLLVFGVVGPALGKAADRYGHRRLYLIGMIGATVFAGLTALAWSAGSLIAFRVLGAAMGAAAGPASLALINGVFDSEQRVKALGYWSMVGAGAPVLGVVAGGPVVEAFGWRWIFVAQVPIMAVALIVAAVVLPRTPRRDTGRFDVAGAVALAVAVTALLVGLNRGAEWGWANPAVLAAFLVVPLALLAFLAAEHRAADPIIPMQYWRRRNFSAPMAAQFFTNFAYMGGFIITPLLLQDVLGFGETRTGLLSIARPLTFAVAGPLAGYVAMRVGERSVGVAGALSVAVSMLGLATVAPGTADLVIAGSLALSGLGLGASSPAMASSIVNAVSDADLGVAGAAQQLVTQVGVVAGIQVLQTVQQSRAPVVGELAAYHEAYLVGAAVCVLGAVAASLVRSLPRGATARAEVATEAAAA